MGRPSFLHPFAKPASEEFIEIVAGEGALVRDRNGHAYVDALASLWYCNVGHGRREIADAVAAQMHRLEAFHTFDKFTNPAADQLCHEVAGVAPMNDARVFLTSSGSEAVDSAIKIARAAHATAGSSQRSVVISREPSYHGVTFGGLAATGLPANQARFGSMLPDVVHTQKDDLDAVAAVFAEHGERVAAVIAEPVVGAAGVYPPRPGYLSGLRELCDTYGAWLILDEVITGFGRLGHWFGAQYYGVRPDLITFAKGITSGYLPLGGVVVGDAVLAAFNHEPDFILRHGHTYSGHPTACAAALANLAILRDEKLIERAPSLGERLATGLRSLEARGAVADVRGDGAVWAVGLHQGADASAVRDAMLSRGVIARPIGADTIAFCPPLVITDEQIDQCVDAVGQAVETARPV
ncbi:aspartate aminotransferase family protein [Actinobacteria bacterium YIM 96077]|uniref:Aspartate aminotransferase family protein n=1 Tax=Phytoactinopolyspora halophila TaxID=1981511 RepID=A0A329QF60_9ACTN|nr:aminotransferase class III-fold pyridoxal phosphate-dependent enzyme [Phytoactinopolyspora halophila]AYY13083.1 aspartate aminotransferase family protein [Actinobacteria bacterium YIM 96077]RAW11095.1 aspartate aminotransferase family protein [Phytoactinopolyspora halophila]